VTAQSEQNRYNKNAFTHFWVICPALSLPFAKSNRSTLDISKRGAKFFCSPYREHLTLRSDISTLRQG
jgi:hypothetical protein